LRSFREYWISFAISASIGHAREERAAPSEDTDGFTLDPIAALDASPRIMHTGLARLVRQRSAAAAPASTPAE
jgi:hypothetical protein